MHKPTRKFESQTDVDEVKLIALVESFENAYLYDGEHSRKISFKPSRILRRYRIHVDRKAFCRKNTVISVFTQPVREGVVLRSRQT